uniref:Pru domain-containing protein n=1 Tax=Arcella intermedia TaxID=1963864 RepID=A0A6B2LF22_9EUKA
MHYDLITKQVNADKRKGLIQLKQGEDNLIQFLWKDRTTGTEVFKKILFPGDAVFRKVDEAKGRVYLLDYKPTNEKFFYWLQEPKEDKDKEHCDNINKFINDPPQPQQNAGLGGAGSPFGMDQAQLRQVLQAGGFGGVDPNQLMQMLGSEGLPARRTQRPRPQPSAAPTTQPPAPQPSSALNRTTLQNILGLLPTNPPASAPSNPSNAPNANNKEDDKTKKEAGPPGDKDKKPDQ